MLQRLLVTFILISVLLSGCSKSKPLKYIPAQKTIIVKKTIIDDILKNWENLDIIDDSIPGISLQKAYNTVLKNKKGEPVIIAFLDQPININHEILKNHIWTNTNEISNNGIDDDNNGYIDDVHGWDFLGISNGVNKRHTLNSSARMVKKYKAQFEGKNQSEILTKDSLNFLIYNNAKLALQKSINQVPEEINFANDLSTMRKTSRLEVLKKLKIKDLSHFSLKDLDSLKALYPKDSTYQQNISLYSDFEREGTTEEYIAKLKEDAAQLLKKQLNIDYNDRLLLGDDPNDITDISYGDNKINTDLNIFTHGTRVSSLAIKGTSEIKIMALPIFGENSTNDKDTALSIRYAVDNGAKIINMSWSEEFSSEKKWVDDALMYAEKHNVILITSAGNSFKNIDKKNNYFYPNDTDANGNEITDNFLIVGNSSYKANDSLVNKYSNYGKNSVDLFAPGAQIRVAIPGNGYKIDLGTSLSAAVVSKVAALLFSYYPNLTATQVKHILMDSGVEYNFNVRTPIWNGKGKHVPFKSLSKSGKIVNAYNALIMADSISRVNKRK